METTITKSETPMNQEILILKNQISDLQESYIKLYEKIKIIERQIELLINPPNYYTY